MPKLCIALDVDLRSAEELVEQLSGLPLIFKVGPGLLLEGGSAFLKRVRNSSSELFLDLKLHDIPNTVRIAVQRAEDLGTDYLTLHTLGGEEMLSAAVSAGSRVKLLGVTLLTSHGEEILRTLRMGFANTEELVLHLASLARRTGLDGVVCSAREVRRIKERMDLIAVVPGIRLSSSRDDQVRVSTPEFAVSQGADVIVVGRDVYRSENPRGVVEALLEAVGGQEEA